MADGADTMLARTLSSINDVEAETWNALANPPGAPFNPFLAHEFLAALEASKSVAPETGWAPMHLVLEDAGDIIAAAPLYVKSHSQGEYVFDHHWADAYERAGGRYYPKLLCAAPFTPVPGPRLLAKTPAARLDLASSLAQVARKLAAPTVHVNFTSKDEQEVLADVGFLPRIGEQFHWFNRGYKSFDDFLAALSSRKRKAIRRERRDATAGGLVIRHLIGNAITEKHWDAFWLFYQDTGARKWGHPYLTHNFFRRVATTMSDRLVFIVAERNGEPVAGALNFIGGDALYGRYWGCIEDIPFLHFELCYYQAVEFAIRNGLARIEAGAQGEHKIARGYEPRPTYSAHWIADGSFREAVARYLEAEREQTGLEIEALKAYMPYRRAE